MDKESEFEPNFVLLTLVLVLTGFLIMAVVIKYPPAERVQDLCGEWKNGTTPVCQLP